MKAAGYSPSRMAVVLIAAWLVLLAQSRYLPWLSDGVSASLRQEARGDTLIPIYTIQGSGDSSPLAGTTVSLEGVVVGDFQGNALPDSGDLSGFYVQDPAGDGDASTSDAIFVYAPAVDALDVAPGDHVRVRGRVSEYYGLTEVTADEIVLCASGVAVTPVPVVLPWASEAAPEAFEGMLVTFTQPLVIAGTSDLDRYGELLLTSSRQLQPTMVYEPDSQAAADLLRANRLARIALDDGHLEQFPEETRHPNGAPVALDKLLRSGDTLTGVTGIMDCRYGSYRIQPTCPATYTPANPRPEAPAAIPGALRVASFNVLNYFTTIDTAGALCGPELDQECRGADTEEELLRQRAKIIAALAAIDADVVGLIEIENHPGDVPVADLVSGLNDAVGAGTYDFVATGAIGIDAIRQAFIYKPEAVSLVGVYAVFDDPSFTNPLGYLQDDGVTPDEMSRPALAQTFLDRASGQKFTVVVNHFKSRGSPCDPLAGDDGLQDDDPIQGNCNLTRTLGAQALVDWLAADPTGSGDGNLLLIGDLNAYACEDPIDVVLAAGYADLVAAHAGEAAYSYVYDGQVGYLDHVLVSASLQHAKKIAGLTVWHINADEPDLIDYTMTSKSDGQDLLYAPDPYRSSDHDPVIIGLGLANMDYQLWLPLVLR